MPPGRRTAPMKPPAKVAASVSAASRPLSPPRGQQPPPSDASSSRGRPGRDGGASRALTSGVSRLPAASASTTVGVDVPQHLSAPRPLPEATVAIVPTSDARCYEVLIPPTLMKQLGLLPGCTFVTIETETERITCEAGLSLTLTKATIGLHPVVAAIMVDNDGSIQKCATVPSPLTQITVKPVSGDLGLEGARLASLAVISPVQLEAVLRRHCQGHVAFVSMIVSVRIATQEFRLEVVALSDKNGDARRGMFLAATEVCVVMNVKHEDNDAESSDTKVSDDQRSDRCSTILITGDFGCGKSFRLRNERDLLKRTAGISNSLEIAVAEFLLKNSQGGVSNATALRELFREARASSPCVVTVDDLHLLCPASSSPAIASAWSVSQLSATMASEIDALPGSGVYFIASSPSVDALSPQLAAYHRLGRKVISVGPPSSGSERLEVLRSVFAEIGGDTDAFKPLACALATVAEHTHGCTQRDLSRLKGLAASEAFQRSGSIDTIDAQDILTAAKKLRPSALRNMEVAIPNVSWADIGGSSAAKSALQDCVDWCLGKNKWIFETFKLSPPKGVLLYGPPGCSKTMLAKALANESKMNFISIKGPEVFSKWVGDSEKAVRDIFRKARAVAPCVVFVDELDGMCGHRGSGGVSDRVISQFLTELDGLPAAMSEKSDSIILVAATNRPENIDGAVLRPGRIDKKVYVGLPDEQEREAIAQLHIRRMPTSPDVTASLVAQRTPHYTGAEVVAVCKEAAFHALERDFSTNAVVLADVEAALKKVVPRIGTKEVEWYQQWARGRR
jgi:SpoVK/Ycf46/Vps4 family AAA+-type ATPase